MVKRGSKPHTSIHTDMRTALVRSFMIAAAGSLWTWQEAERRYDARDGKDFLHQCDSEICRALSRNSTRSVDLGTSGCGRRTGRKSQEERAICETLHMDSHFSM